MRRLLALLIVALIVTAGAVRGEPATVRLDLALIAEIAGLVPLRGAAPTPDRLAGKIVVVSFFASWCPPCHTEFRHLAAIGARYRGADVEIVAINLFEDFGGLSSPVKLERFLDKYDPTYSVLSGTDATARAFGGVRRIPTLYVFDRAGHPAFGFVHEIGATKTNVGARELAAVIDALL